MADSQALPRNKPNPIANIPPEKRSIGRPKASLPDVAAHNAISLEKHANSLRYKAAYSANVLADEIARAVSKPGKKDYNLVKGLVWSFGVMFDKATGGQSSESVSIRIPAKLLDNVKAVIAIQASKKAKPTPPAIDSQSSVTLINPPS